MDPDNRGPLDVAALADALKQIKAHSPRNLSEEKLALTRAILRLRRSRPQDFVGPEADYTPLATSTAHLVAFARGKNQDVVTVASRLLRSLGGRDGLRDHTVVLPDGTWKDIYSSTVFEGGSQEAEDLLRHMPVAVLERV